MSKQKNKKCISLYLRNRIHYLNELNNQNRQGRYLLLSKGINCLTGEDYFSIEGVNGEAFPQPEDYNSSKTRTPVCSVSFVRKGLVYHIFDNSKQLLVPNDFDCSLTRNKAHELAYKRALKIANIVSRRTGLALVERTNQYS